MESSSPVVRPHIPEGVTIIFEGPQRVGKTLAGVIWSLDAFQHGRNVFSNIQLGFPHEPLDFNEIQLEDGSRRYWNGHIFIDELNFYFDARRSMKADNIKFSAFLLQQKKQGCNLTGTTHDLMSLDVRIRENFDFLIRPRVWPEYPQAPQVLKMVIESGPLQRPLRRSLTIDCRPFLGLYDTSAVYNPFKEPPKKDTADGDEVWKPKKRRVTF